MEPQIPSAQFYRDLGTWLKALGDYALLQADQLEGATNAPSHEPPAVDVPAHWLAALGSGPPEHWLRLVERARVTKWSSSEQFSPPALAVDASAKEAFPPGEKSGPSAFSPSTPTAAPSGQEPLKEAQRAEQPGVQVPLQRAGTVHSKGQRPPGKPVAGSSRESIPAEILRPDEESRTSMGSEVGVAPPDSRPQQQVIAQAAPMEPVPTHLVTHLRLRAAQEMNRDRPEPAAGTEPRTNLSVAVEAAHPEPPRARHVKAPVRARVKARQASVKSETAAAEEASGSLSAEPETKSRLIEQRISKHGAKSAPLTEAPAPAEEAKAILPKSGFSSRPIYPARPATQSQPTRWPTESGHWPDLPQRRPDLDSSTNEQLDLDRQQRLDREQQGRPWNA